MKRIGMVLLVAALAVVAMTMGSPGPAFGEVVNTELPGCAGVNNAQIKGAKASPVLFANCGNVLPPGQKVREGA